uniref:DUF7041 domain-containing protein n=1 Tax=Trichogramma kaykai TaxID=54128 RepID=A0ABD2X807_9HYME
MVVPRDDNRLVNFEDQQQQAPGANGQMSQDQQQQPPGASVTMSQDQQRQALGANGQPIQRPGLLEQQQQLQDGLINQPHQLGAGLGDDVPPRGVGAVSNCRLPPFWRTGPELWFFQIESQFQVHNVTSDATKYHLVVAALDTSIIRSRRHWSRG